MAQAQFDYTTTNGQITITGYTGPRGAVDIPSKIGGLPVTSIGTGAFYQCRNIISISIPDSVISIGDYAFYGCPSLASVTISSGVVSIGDYAFYDCGALMSITIPKSVTSIGTSAFSGCRKMSSITVDPLNSVYSSLSGVLFNKNQTALIEYPCGTDNAYTIPSGVTSVTNSAFSNSHLPVVTIPSSVTSIGSGAFAWCPYLSAIFVDTGNPAYTSMRGVLFDKQQLTLIQFPAGKYESSYMIPEGVTTIGDWAFFSVYALANLTIPKSVTNIKSYAFAYCKTLKNAIFIGDAPSMGTSVFYSSASEFAVYYFYGATGFASPIWSGYPAVNMGASSPVTPWLISKGVAYNSDLRSATNDDGVPLLMAYALNLDPTRPQSGSVPRPVVTGDQMSLTYYAGSEGVTYSVESSTDLLTWDTTGVTVSALDANNFRTATVPATGPRRFMRLVVSY